MAGAKTRVRWTGQQGSGVIAGAAGQRGSGAAVQRGSVGGVRDGGVQSAGNVRL